MTTCSHKPATTNIEDGPKMKHCPVAAPVDSFSKNMFLRINEIVHTNFGPDPCPERVVVAFSLCIS